MRKLGLGNPFNSPKPATAPARASPTPVAPKQTTPRSTQRHKASIPMTGELSTLKRETRPYWIKWIVKNGEPYRLWIPGFLKETAPDGYVPEGSKTAL
jgi:hypothetical protein